MSPQRILHLHSLSPLRSLAEACLALTPKVSLYGERDLFLELSATVRLFGGETEQLFCASRLMQAFAARGEVVLCDRPEWARALATEPEIYLAPGTSQARLLELPIERLVPCGDPATLEEEGPERRALASFMRRVGMRRIADFVRLPAGAVGRRFGRSGVRLQEWALGKRELLLLPFLPSEPVREAQDTEGIASLEELLFALRACLGRLEHRLRGRALAASEISLTFQLEGRKRLGKRIGLAEPQREAQPLLRLLRDALEGMSWDSPLERLEIEISDAVPFEGEQLSLLGKQGNRFGELADYVNRLRARCGEQAVGFPQLEESYLPERSWKNIWPPRPGKGPDAGRGVGSRPLFLFTPPRPYSVPRAAKLVPAENLAVEWWEEEGGYRRYFVAHTSSGERLWIYWDVRNRQWFLQGTFD